MIKSLLKLLLFWILFFFIQRIVFLLINYDAITFGWREIWQANYKALGMDIATSTYLIALPALLLMIHSFVPSFNSVFQIISYFNKVIVIICTFIAVSDDGIYKVWGTKINGKALSYLAYPQEVLPTLFAIENIGLLIIIAAQVIFLFRLYSYFHPQTYTPSLGMVSKAVLSLALTGLIIIGMRGGLQRVPLNRNWVFHSPHAVLNYASLNGIWNFIDLLAKPVDPETNPYAYFEKEKAETLLKSMHLTPADSTTYITSNAKPNIVFIFLESWNPDVMECLGGEKGVTPMFGKLAEEGILFTHFYSTGYRTEQGLLAALSAYPAQPVSSIIQSFGKFDKLPNIIRTFNNNGYHTSFYTGGRLFFDNVEAYLRAAGIQKIMGEDDFEIHKRTVWGAYDEETFALHLRELKNTPQPFFSALTTMTTHEWFDADVPKYFPEGNDKVGNNYRNTMHYADSCLYAYMQEAKKQPWYNNTLYVIMADHSCKFPKQRSNNETERHHIPMLITGGALKETLRGKPNNRVAMHTDIPATILAQCRIKDAAYVRSKNIFNPYAPAFAYYAFDNGFGWITTEQKIIFDHIQQKELLHNTSDSTITKLINLGKAYLQTSFQENMDYAEKKAATQTN